MNVTDKAFQSVLFSILTKATGRSMTKESVAEEEIKLRAAWYQSQVEGTHYEESEYTGSIYPWLAWDCWRGWSKLTCGNVLKALSFMEIPPSTSIADLGAGIGLTTAQLAQFRPQAQLIYTNLEGPQAAVAREIFKTANVEDRITMITDGSDATAQVVVASELLEHLPKPLEFLQSQLKEAIIYFDCSSFTLESHGHLLTYQVDDKPVGREKMKRMLNQWLRSKGWKELRKVRPNAPKFWNNRPAVWVKDF